MVIMKKNTIYIMTAMLITISSCKDLYEVKEPFLDVQTTHKSYKVGDTVTFDIKTDVDIISFYSGDFGNDYAYRDSKRIYAIIPFLSFRSAKYSGNNADCADLLYSYDFNGDYSLEGIQSANWTSLSNRFYIPGIETDAPVFSKSGSIDISDIFSKDQPVYFAWHCKVEPKSNRTRFQIADFTITGEIKENTALSGTLYSQQMFGFQWVLNEAAANQSPLPRMINSIVFWDGSFSNSGLTRKEGYAISGPILPREDIDLGTDLPNPIKSIQQENMTKYTYSYDKPGEYTVTFVGRNTSFKGERQIVKQLHVQVTE